MMFKAELWAAEVYKTYLRCFKKVFLPNFSKLSLPGANYFFPTTMGGSDLRGGAQFRKLWKLHFLAVQDAGFPIVYEHVHTHSC